MTTIIQILQAFGVFVLGFTVRSAVILGVIALLSLPFIAYAYAASAVESFWHRRHGGPTHAHGVA
jgi:hypothetical protein